MSSRNYDFIVVGAGIVGLTMAREIKQNNPKASILVLEKESDVGFHSSGRNSGILHSGIYYSEGSLKAKLCASGAREMAAYCKEHGLPLAQTGKIILPVSSDDKAMLHTLHQRAKANGAKAEIIDEKTLRELEDKVHSPTGEALWCPETSVIDPVSVLRHLLGELRERGVEILFNEQVTKIKPQVKKLTTSQKNSLSYGYLVNTAGLHADTIAHAYEIGQKYVILPFKGIYYDLDAASGINLRHQIYPVPDLRVPFLGVHFTRGISGKVYIGPTAIPVFGRENYHGLKGLDWGEAPQIIYRIAQQYLLDKQGFRQLTHEEAFKLIKPWFTSCAQKLVPSLKKEHIKRSHKVGIRAQLLDKEKRELVMDFVVEKRPDSFHVLNAVSPAFTCSLSFARYALKEWQS